MTDCKRRGYRSHSRIEGFALFLLLVLYLSSVEAPLVSHDANILTETVTHSKIALTTTGNRIAVVKPIFTATAYSKAFYTFYSKYSSVPPGEYITTDLDLLNRTVVDGWGWSAQLNAWFGKDTARSLHLVLGETVTLIDEIAVDRGELFHDDVRLYDVLILGFTEYVTEREYLYYKQFVMSGGILIIMDACNFLAEVTYSNGYLSLTKGHGWEFNGTHAWKSTYHRWYEDNRNWVGSNYWQYWTGRHYRSISVNISTDISNYIRSYLGEDIPTDYTGHEENILQNLTATDIIGYWNFVNASEAPNDPVAAYIHRYRNGMVIHSGVMASDVILSDRFLSVFLATSLRFALTGEVSQWTYPEPLVSSDDVVESTIAIYEKYGGSASGTLSGVVHCDINFNVTTEVLRNCYRCNLKSVTGELIDTNHQVLHNTIIQARTVNITCWRLDIITYFITNGNYSLVINATWRGVRCSHCVTDSIAVLYFNVENNWWMSVLPWAAPLCAVISVAIIIVAYTKLSQGMVKNSRESDRT